MKKQLTFSTRKVSKLNSSDIKKLIGKQQFNQSVFYTYNVNDSLTLRPGVAFAMPTQDADDIEAGNDDLGFFSSFAPSLPGRFLILSLHFLYSA